MLDLAIQAFGRILQPEAFLFMGVGLFVGAIVGLLPGMGGVVGMSILLPFIYGMDPTSGVAMLIGMVSVCATSDAFTSILMGVPGSAGAQALIMDGYPLTKQGRGAEALGASFSASLVGGLFSAVFLFLIISVARPIILAFGSPELLVLIMIGLSMVAVLSKGAARLGILAALIGLILGSVGGAPTVPVYRFTFEQLYLFDGLKIGVVALGLFAIPEMVDLLVSGESISPMGSRAGMWKGFMATLKRPFLVMQSSAIGTALGLLPGLGSVTDWVCYAVAAKTTKNGHKFGRGEVDGVIAPAAADNAHDGGALVPTLLFGIPASGTTAVLLAGLMIMNVQPGIAMATNNLDLVLAIIWTLVLANVFGTLLCMVTGRWMAKLASVPAEILAPFMIVTVVVAAYQTTQQWGDIVALAVFGFIGWIMRHTGMPRSACLIGFVLANSAERYLWTTVGTFGASWLYRPGVIILGIVLFLILAFSIRDNARVSKRAAETLHLDLEQSPQS